MTKVTSIRLPDELVDRLDRIARSLDRPRGWVIRQALSSYLQLQEAVAAGAPQSTPLEKVIAALEGMIEDAAERDSETDARSG
jgi:metal-responsive CopG/Arc/MetJ family transcriptional regulator